MTTLIRKATLNDIEQIYELYKAVARHNPGNLTQEEYEITLDYVEEMVKSGLERGLILVTEKEGEVIGYFKAFTSKFKCLAHVLDNATAMVLPVTSGLGAKLITFALNTISKEMRHIEQFDIVPHEANKLAIRLYSKLGFEMRFNNKAKIRNYDGSFGGELLMSWYNPNFCTEELEKYHVFLKQKYFVQNNKKIDDYIVKKVQPENPRLTINTDIAPINTDIAPIQNIQEYSNGLFDVSRSR